MAPSLLKRTWKTTPFEQAGNAPQREEGERNCEPQSPWDHQGTHLIDGARVLFDGADALAVVHAPHADGVVCRAAGQAIAVGVKVHAEDAVLVAWRETEGTGVILGATLSQKKKIEKKSNAGVLHTAADRCAPLQTWRHSPELVSHILTVGSCSKAPE